ncbi:hypothetical protein ONS95_002680 [Cadophora gregata]|uniref:uncharacterized protein n=1 Tax=Cadophora gregata TaxID=51156 RepID=UPI0026DA786C|nr:uncharacterized protein ONS95_002680 [Cadophora gregata]KAK0110019.1 hypothetical protein ONS95_002680 [Cadophora gregata]KAK0110358.1 hypothetical protein ONS96_001974 [Cadophora gregata f. sp. sojae]
MSTSRKNFQFKVKKEDVTAHAKPTPNSQRLNDSLNQLSSAYASDNMSAIHDALTSFNFDLESEKEIEKKRIKVKKDNEFAEQFDKSLDVKDSGKAEVAMENEITRKGGSKGKTVKKETCCGCGGCNEL